MWPPETILHPTDFSECSKHAFQLACELAKQSQAKVVVLHSHIPPVLVPGEIPPPDELHIQSKEEARQLLNRVVPENTNVRLEHRLVTGSAVEAILDTARQIDADLIVMGTQGRKGVKRFLLGSVAENVLRRAECPVLTARPSSKQQKKITNPTTVGKSKESSTHNLDSEC